MTYRTHKEQTRLIMAAGAAATIIIAALGMLGSLTGGKDALAACQALQSASTCLYALR